MCGIVGLVPKPLNGFNWNHQKMFAQMLFANLLRGADSTGVFGAMKGGDFGIMKEANDSYFFGNSYDNSELEKKLYQEGRAVIGHNRAKTIGANVDENAHPFVVDDTFVMVHNGTLRNHKKLFDTEVDSEALAKLFKEAMDQEDWKTALEDAIGKVDGAFAVIWFDQKRNQLCLLRNSERPLGYLETPTAFLIASELALANWIGTRNGEKCENFKSCAIHTLYTFDLEKGNGALQETNLFPTFPKKKGYNNGVLTAPTSAPTAGVGQDNLATGMSSIAELHGYKPGNEELSKNAFKRLRGRMMQSTIDFICEDYVPGAGGTFKLMGRSMSTQFDLLETKHNITGTLNGWSHAIEESDFWVNEPFEFTGRVQDMSYDAKAKSVEILLCQLEPKKYVKALH